MIPSKTILPLLLILAWLTSYGQTTAQKQPTARLNKIDLLQTDKEVFAFIKEKFPEITGKEKFDKYFDETPKIADSLKAKNWIKADINNDGETDLLVFRAYH
jgi:hypothetical protein